MLNWRRARERQPEGVGRPYADGRKAEFANVGGRQVEMQ
jgi:hypothetical protein